MVIIGQNFLFCDPGRILLAESLKIQVDLPVSPERVYRAWLDSYEHSRFTGSPASIDARVGGEYSAWDGYIQGKTLVMTPFTRIVQTWRSTDFPEDSPDSTIEIRFEPTCLGSLVTLEQTGIPGGQSREYLQGWEEHYFRPLKNYFDEQVGESSVDIDG
jgi:uncharacterized protein YndB with AHSA1/START domain